MKENPPYPQMTRQPRSGAVVLKAALGLLLCLLSFRHASAAGETDPPYDEISIYLKMQGVGGAEIAAAIHNDTAYLAVTDVLDFIKIKNTATAGMDSITGVFLLQRSSFVIDKPHNRILFGDKKTELPPGVLIRTATNVYLRCDYFGLIFGLNCKFSFRSLSVQLTTNLELPIIREMRQEAMRNNLNRLKGEAKVDTTIQRSYPLFRLGMADWAIVTTHQSQDGSMLEDNRLNLGLGGVVAGGETAVSLNYDNNTPLAGNQQFYQWRHVDNDNPALRQVTAGKILTPSISSIYSPILGLQFTNAPTFYRRSFGTYTLTYYSEADWVVELYVNNSLVDYARTATTGYFTFQVPLIYGYSQVKLKFYGPYGEEKLREENIQIPFNFLPVGEFEYTASGGLVQDSLNSRLGRFAGHYGLSKRLTFGGGLEYLSANITGKFIPFVDASLRLRSDIMLSGEYAYGVRTKFTGVWHLPSNLQLELYYTRYKKGQQAINNLYLEERKAVLSYPFRYKKFALFSRLSVYQVVLPNTEFTTATKYTTIEGLTSGVFFGINTNLTTYAWFTQQAAPYVYSNLNMVFRVPGKLILTPQVQYEYQTHQVIDTRLELGKYFSSSGYFNAYYENNTKGNLKSIGIGMRYNFKFATTAGSATRAAHSFATVESASGGILYDDKAKFLGVSPHSSLGRGGITVRPFLDLNGNGRRDAGEPAVAGLNVRINGGYVQNNATDTVIRVTDLEGYATYILRLDALFENVAWSIRNKTIRIIVDPNQFRDLDVPVSIAAEVSGMVYYFNGPDSARSPETARPMDRIVISFYYTRDSTLAGQATTEADGSFDYSGLKPGSYLVCVDAAQLRKLQMRATPAVLTITIHPNKDGDVVDKLAFYLRKR
jgi:hypothetical protein